MAAELFTQQFSTIVLEALSEEIQEINIINQYIIKPNVQIIYDNIWKTIVPEEFQDFLEDHKQFITEMWLQSNQSEYVKRHFITRLVTEYNEHVRIDPCLDFEFNMDDIQEEIVALITQRHVMSEEDLQEMDANMPEIPQILTKFEHTNIDSEMPLGTYYFDQSGNCVEYEQYSEYLMNAFYAKRTNVKNQDKPSSKLLRR